MNRRRMMMAQQAAVVDPYEQQYLTLTSTDQNFGDTQFIFSMPSTYTWYYSLDNGTTWSALTTSDDITVACGASMLLKGNGVQQQVGSQIYSGVSASGTYVVSGNIMSLVYGDDFVGKKTFPATSMNFRALFSGETELQSAENLRLPATTLNSNCYHSMFNGCTAMAKGPSSLPATTLAGNCYYSMFYNCSAMTNTPELAAATSVPSYAYYQMFYGCANITTAPELTATSLTDYAYTEMFRGCSNLVTAPTILPATTLTSYCYKGMFRGCSKLTNTPELPAASLVSNCYAEMFYGCSLVNSIKCLATSRAATNNTTNWVNGVAASGTFTKASSATFWGTGNGDIPSGWTVQDAT